MIDHFVLIRRWPVLATLLLTVASPALADQSLTYDCGTLALYTLLHIEGKTIGLSELERVLPPPSPHGYSLKELRDAARACGLALEGIGLKDKLQAPDRPILAYLKRGEHGHYIVLRPVGQLGKMVQVFDNDSEPEVLDMSEIAASSGWIGLELRPIRTDWPLRISILSATMALLGVFALVRHRFCRTLPTKAA